MLLIDTHRHSTTPASAASSLVHGLMAAGGVAAMEPLCAQVRIGSFFRSLSGVLFVFGQALVWAIRAKGMGWRLERGGFAPRPSDKTTRPAQTCGSCLLKCLGLCYFNLAVILEKAPLGL